MTAVRFAFTIVSLLLLANFAHAQATRTWVSGVGDDANPCSRTAPCKTFAGAIAKTAAGGEIDTLDPAGYGAVTITKSIIIANEGVGEAGILAAGTNGVVVNAGPNDIVTLRGLVIDGGPTNGAGPNGVRFLVGGVLHIQNSVIRNFTAAGDGYGVQFTPMGPAELYIDDTLISDNGGGGGAGILVRGSVKASLTNVRVENNFAGLVADGAASVAVDSSTFAGNTDAGLTASGGATVRLNGSTVTGNGTGLNATGGTIGSYKTNRIDGNGNNGTATPLNLN